MRLPLVAAPVLAVALAVSAHTAVQQLQAVRAAAAASRSARQVQTGPRVVIRIADVTDCGGSGTTCPEFTHERHIRVALDGSFEPLSETPLRFAPGPGARPWGLTLGRTAVHVRWPGQTVRPLDLALHGLGRQPQLTWSPGAQRFALLEDFQRTGHPNRVLVVDPAQRRDWRLPLARDVREIWSLAWRRDDRLVAQIVSRHRYLKLVELDAVTGGVRRARFIEHAFETIDWSPAAGRLAVEDEKGRVGVLALAEPTVIRWTKLKGVPRWSPDGTRILITHPECGGCDSYVPPSDGFDTRYPQIATWPGGTTVRLADDIESGLWLPDGHTLIGLQGDTDFTTNAPARLVQIGDGGQVERTIPVQWPARIDPDNELALLPSAVPTMLDGLDRSAAAGESGAQ